MPVPSQVHPFVPVAPILEESGEHIAQPAPETAQPAPAATEPASQPDGQPPQATPEIINWRWRNETLPVPIGVLDALATALKAPSREAVVTWTQQGRDIEYHSAKLREDQNRIAQREREIEAERQRLDAIAQDLDARGYAPSPGAPGYGVPTQPAYPQGGYGPANPYSNPGGYPTPGGYAPVVPPQWGGYLPADPQQREQLALQALLSIPHQVRAATEPIVQELRAEKQNQARAAIARSAQEEEAQLARLAGSYVEKLKNEGWKLPEDFDGNALIEDCNRMGLSMNPDLPWTEALETAAARRLWRHGLQTGAGFVVSELETNREATFRVPPAKPAAPAAPPPALNARIQAARQIGETISMREALE